MQALFALQENIGGRGKPFLQYWILEDDENWGDAVRGDGHSYRPGGPAPFFSLEGESLINFEERVLAVMKDWREE